VLVDDILDLSKIEASRLELQDNRPGAPGARREHPPPADAARHRQRVGAPLRDRPRGARAPAGRRRPVAAGALEPHRNAVKFTPAGTVAVRIEPEAAGERLRFVVEDTGIGISEKDQGRLFNPFSQADSTAARPFGGAAWGLPISKRLVELMGGTIEVQSTREVGSVFSFAIPARPPTEPRRRPESRTAGLRDRRGRRRKLEHGPVPPGRPHPDRRGQPDQPAGPDRPAEGPGPNRRGGRGRPVGPGRLVERHWDLVLMDCSCRGSTATRPPPPAPERGGRLAHAGDRGHRPRHEGRAGEVPRRRDGRPSGQSRSAWNSWRCSSTTGSPWTSPGSSPRPSPCPRRTAEPPAGPGILDPARLELLYQLERKTGEPVVRPLAEVFPPTRRTTSRPCARPWPSAGRVSSKRRRNALKGGRQSRRGAARHRVRRPGDPGPAAGPGPLREQPAEGREGGRQGQLRAPQAGGFGDVVETPPSRRPGPPRNHRRRGVSAGRGRLRSPAAIRLPIRLRSCRSTGDPAARETPRRPGKRQGFR